MPLSPPVGRQHLHTRKVTCQGFYRDDGLYDIEDEHDAIKRGVIRREDGSLISQGDVPIRDLNREFGWNLPEDVAITIAGLVLHEARRIPEVGQVYAFYGFRFEILKREGTRIAELRIVPPAAIQAAKS